jgi:hypothetical protein
MKGIILGCGHSCLGDVALRNGVEALLGWGWSRPCQESTGIHSVELSWCWSEARCLRHKGYDLIRLIVFAD